MNVWGNLSLDRTLRKKRSASLRMLRRQMAEHRARYVRVGGQWRAECRTCGWLGTPLPTRQSAVNAFRLHRESEPEVTEPDRS